MQSAGTLFEILKYLSYPDIDRYCRTNRYTYHICQTDENIKRLIINKKFVEWIDNVVNAGYGGSFLIEATRNGNLDQVNEVLKHDIDQASIDSALSGASWDGNLDIVNRLLQDSRTNPADKDNRAIVNAIDRGRLDIVNRLLQDTRVDPTIYDNEMVKIAYQKGHLDIVNRLLQEPGVHL